MNWDQIYLIFALGLLIAAALSKVRRECFFYAGLLSGT